jgi:hypothetical protein
MSAIPISLLQATRPRQEWMKALKAGGDFIYTVVNRVSDLPDDP